MPLTPGGTAPRSVPPPSVMDSEWTVPGLLRRAVQAHGERPFLEVVGGSVETYAEAYVHAQRMAACLHTLGVQPQDKLLIMLANSAEAIHGWLGANLINAIDVSINTGYRGLSLEHAANLSGAKVLLTSSNYLDVIGLSVGKLQTLQTIVIMDDGSLENAALAQAGIRILRYDAIDNGDAVVPHYPANPWDIGSVIYTSGTSGPAKGVLMPHGQITLLAQLTAAKTALGAEDVFFCFYPMYHMAGKFMSALATLSVGGKLVLDTGFVPEQWLDRIRAYGATMTAAHGPMLEMVYALPPSPHDLDHKLRSIRTAPFPKRIAAGFEARFGVRGIEVWGMTEIGIPCWTEEDMPLRVGSCGRVDENWYEVAVVDPETDFPLPPGHIGEFTVRPKRPWIVMQGYLGMPEKTVEAWRNLWFHTGDCGMIDSNGYAFFVDRARERIRRRAENISASDIEAAALSHPAIAEAAAVGVSSGYEGDDDILLCVVPKQGITLTPEKLLRFLVRELPHYMVPRYLQYLEKLPRTVTGKLQRVSLKNNASDASVWDRKAVNISLRDLAR